MSMTHTRKIHNTVKSEREGNEERPKTEITCIVSKYLFSGSAYVLVLFFWFFSPRICLCMLAFFHLSEVLFMAGQEQQFA